MSNKTQNTTKQNNISQFLANIIKTDLSKTTISKLDKFDIEYYFGMLESQLIPNNFNFNNIYPIQQLICEKVIEILNSNN